MHFLIALFLIVLLVWALAYFRLGLIVWAAALVAGFLFIGLGSGSWILSIVLLSAAAICGVMSIDSLRKRGLSAPALKIMRSLLPPISQTEQEALDAGTVSFDADIFAGEINWKKFMAIPGEGLSDEERAFIEGPTRELCTMVNDFDDRFRVGMTPEVWQFLKDKGFLGMLIPREFGGLGFSAQAQSIVLGQIACYSSCAAVSAMVPNSLGPGKLLMKFGTDEQRNYYLPRLAKGDEIPCFALTGPTSGSDAATMRDIGIIGHGQWQGESVLGMRVSWSKRYITLGPVATLVGLAFHVRDPDHLLGKEEDIGITLALIPHDHPGVEIGQRHYPSGNAFQNGPVAGKDVFIPMTFIIGGEQRLGHGWRMLMSCLAVGRAVSLPATSAAALKMATRTTSAYITYRHQFGIPIGDMEGVSEAFEELVANAYQVESARSVTCSLVDDGGEPAVLSAAMKYGTTEMTRDGVLRAMDIHGGRAICDGPNNYLFGMYSQMPVAITVEGANILTRTLITFGQGVLRAHPYLYDEISAAQSDADSALDDFDALLCKHVQFTLGNLVRAFVYNLSGGRLARGAEGGKTLRYWSKQVNRQAANFAMLADLTTLILGGGLKARQKISGRLADVLAEIYFLACVLKRFGDDGEPQEDAVIVDYICERGMYRIQDDLDRVIANYPLRVAIFKLRACIFPLGRRWRGPKDSLGQKLARAAMADGATRDRLTRHVHYNDDPNDVLQRTEQAYRLALASRDIYRKVYRAQKNDTIIIDHLRDWIGDAEAAGVINAEESATLRDAEASIDAAIQVDDFAPEDLVRPNA
ncbi:acyl-CoA dehydrogenase [Gammaproteobacteria bacterium]|nr:acyl-CoA dehydrogenase [Gammaproteobacteria bacterium]